MAGVRRGDVADLPEQDRQTEREAEQSWVILQLRREFVIGHDTSPEGPGFLITIGNLLRNRP